jgi:AcrR family transcriptional regulator
MEQKPRPGGRSSRVRAAVLDAVAEVIAENDLAGMTIDAVARRAGVARTTVYRRWPNRGTLIADLLVSRAAVQIPAPDTGSLDGDLAALAAGAAAALRGENLALLRAAVSSAGAGQEVAEAFRIYWAARTSVVSTIVERAVARGEAPAGTDPELVLHAAAGPLWLAALSCSTPTGGGPAGQEGGGRVPAADEGGQPGDGPGADGHGAAPDGHRADAHAQRVARLVAAAIRAGGASA